MGCHSYSIDLLCPGRDIVVVSLFRALTLALSLSHSHHLALAIVRMSLPSHIIDQFTAMQLIDHDKNFKQK